MSELKIKVIETVSAVSIGKPSIDEFNDLEKKVLGAVNVFDPKVKFVNTFHREVGSRYRLLVEVETELDSEKLMGIDLVSHVYEK